MLALVAGQDVEPGDTEGTWRIARGTSKDRIISVVDPEARHVHKAVHARRDGYKTHVAVEPETGLVNDAALPRSAPRRRSDGLGPDDNAIAESTIGLFKTGLIRRHGPGTPRRRRAGHAGATSTGQPPPPSVRRAAPVLDQRHSSPTSAARGLYCRLPNGGDLPYDARLRTS